MQTFVRIAPSRRQLKHLAEASRLGCARVTSVVPDFGTLSVGVHYEMPAGKYVPVSWL
jgi:hypothetical protein